MARLYSQDSRLNPRGSARLLSLAIVIAISCACIMETGCCQTLFPNRAARNQTMRQRRQKRLQPVEETQEAPVEYADMVLQTEAAVEQIRIAPDARHIIVESSASADPSLFASFDSIDQQLVAVELWNIEFADPRRETFANDRASIAANLNAVAFDKSGKRLFWSDKEVRAGLLAQQDRYDAVNNDELIIRGASYDQIPSSRYYTNVPQNNSVNEDHATIVHVPYTTPSYNQTSEATFPDLDEIFQPVETNESLDEYQPTAQNPAVPTSSGYLEMAAVPSDVVPRPAANSPILPTTNQPIPQNAPAIPWTTQIQDDDAIELTHDDIEGQVETANGELILQEQAEDEQTDDDPQTADDAEQEQDQEQEETEEPIQVDPRDVMALQEFESIESLQNVVLTKPLVSGASLFMAPRNNPLTLDDRVKHMKTAPEMKAANAVWISKGSKWIVCHGNQDADDMIQDLKALDQKVNRPQDATAKAEQETAEYNPNWALVSMRDRKRVVRFPMNVKMTFDASTSEDEINGKIVDILDVSDAGELVATLVEENPELSLNMTPRYKIVVWDINVASTVDLDKAKLPLMALEVAQIAIAAPVTRRFCKFNEEGTFIAARVEPRYISLWQATNGKLVAELGEHRDVVTDFDFAHGESKMAVATSAGVARIVLWELRKGIVLKTLDDVYGSKNAVAVAFTDDNQYVYFANDLGHIKRWALKH